MYDILKEIIKNEAILEHYNSAENSFFIKETDPSAKCTKIVLDGFDDINTTIGFELDCKKIKCGTYHKLSPYFNDGKNLDKGNDAIIFSKINLQNYIFICELKDDSASSKLDKQLKSSTCFVDYLKSILNNFHGINIKALSPIYLVFSKHGNNLRPTGVSRSKTMNFKGLDVFFLDCSAKKNIKSFI